MNHEDEFDIEFDNDVEIEHTHILEQHNLAHLESCLCCQPKHHMIAKAAHRCVTIEELIALRDHLRQYRMPQNLERYFEELITRRQKNEAHASIDEQD